jgi:hypothetical protein
MDTKYTIEKLNDENYMIWAMKVKLVLQSKRLWGHITGEVGSSDGNEDLTQSERQAMAEIMLNIESRFLAIVLNKKTPKEVWDTLASLHKNKTVANKRELRRKLLNLKMGENQTIQEFANSICDIENRLALGGHLLSAEDKEYALLEGLPKEYELLKMMLEEDNTSSFSEKVAKLQLREAAIRTNGAKSGPSERGTALIAHGRKPNKNIQCHYCKKKGHIKSKCFFNPESQNYKPNLKQNTTNNSQETPQNQPTNQGSVQIIFIASPQDRNINEKGFLDSCASQHMCKDAKLFTSIQDSAGYSIDSAADGGSMEIQGVGTVIIQTELNGMKHNITLHDVAYMPESRTNLISIPMAQKAGLGVEFTPDSAICKVAMNGQVIMEGCSTEYQISEVKLCKLYNRRRPTLQCNRSRRQSTWHCCTNGWPTSVMIPYRRW